VNVNEDENETQLPSSEEPPRPAAWKAWASLGAAGAGLALALGRYVFLPLQLSPGRWVEALLVGTAVALMTTGWRGWRVARPATGGVGRSPAGLALAGLPALAVLLGLWAVARVSSEVALAPVALPGIDALLPAWEVRDHAASSGAGQHAVKEPGRSGFVELRWASDSMQPGEILDFMFRQLSALGEGWRVVRRERATVDGHEGELLIGATGVGDLHVAVTAWICPQDHRALWLVTLLHRPVEDLAALHQRMLAALRCHTGKGEKRLAPARFPPPAELTRNEHPTDQVFTGPADLVDISPGAPGRQPFEGMGRPEIRDRVVEVGLQVTGATLREARAGGGGGGERRCWTGEARDGDQQVRVTLVALYCAGNDASYLGMHLAPADGPAGRGVELLSRVDCP
jgi:hypothetical protein